MAKTDGVSLLIANARPSWRPAAGTQPLRAREREHGRTHEKKAPLPSSRERGLRQGCRYAFRFQLAIFQ
jgi:hypothetical protein